MPLDPSIPLGVRPATFNMGDMFGAMAGVQQMRAQQDQSRLYGLKLRDAERDEADQLAINQALQQSVGPDGAPNYSAAAQALERAGRGLAGQKLRAAEQAQRKALAEAAKAELEAKAEGFKTLDTQLGVSHMLLSAVKKQPENYGSARAQISRLLGPEIGGLLPETYDPAAIDRALAWGENAQSTLKVREQVTREIAQNLLTEKNERESFNFWTKNVGAWLETTEHPEDRAEAYALARKVKVPEAVIAQFGDPADPTFKARVRAVLIDPEKREQMAETTRHNRQTEGLTASAQREQGRHNRQIEGLTAEQVGLTRRALAQKELDPEQIGPVADMVLRDPDQLKNFTATERGKIMKFIATDRGGATPNRRAESMLEITGLAQQTLRDIKNHPGFAGAVGAKGPSSLFGILDRPIAGTNAADFVDIFETLESRLTLPRLELMRGLGAMSEKEFGTLKNAASSLKRSRSESGFRSELGNVEATLDAVEKRLRAQINTGGAGVGGLTVAPGGGVSSAGGPETLLDPNGIPRVVPADKVAEFLRRGGRRQ